MRKDALVLAERPASGLRWRAEACSPACSRSWRHLPDDGRGRSWASRGALRGRGSLWAPSPVLVSVPLRGGFGRSWRSLMAVAVDHRLVENIDADPPVLLDSVSMMRRGPCSPERARRCVPTSAASTPAVSSRAEFFRASLEEQVIGVPWVGSAVALSVGAGVTAHMASGPSPASRPALRTVRSRGGQERLFGPTRRPFGEGSVWVPKPRGWASAHSCRRIGGRSCSLGIAAARGSFREEI